jgi:hypothetical protein
MWLFYGSDLVLPPRISPDGSRGGRVIIARAPKTKKDSFISTCRLYTEDYFTLKLVLAVAELYPVLDAVAVTM